MLDLDGAPDPGPCGLCSAAIQRGRPYETYLGKRYHVKCFARMEETIDRICQGIKQGTDEYLPPAARRPVT